MTDLDELFQRATDRERGVHREAGDVPRRGDRTPYRADPTTLTKKGTPKLTPAGRPSNAGAGLVSGLSLARHREAYLAKGLALVMPWLIVQLGSYPELWDLADRRTREILNTAIAEGPKLAGYWVKADRGTLAHLVLQRVAETVIAGGPGTDAELADLEPAAVELGLTLELLEGARSLFAEFFARVAVPLASEVHAVHPTFNKLGTADLILQWLIDLPELWISAGDVTGADLKSGRVDGLTVIEHHAQLASYFGDGSMAYVFDDPDDLTDMGHPAPWPWPVSRDRAVIVHLPLDDAIAVGDLRLDLVGIDLIVGVSLLELAAEVAAVNVAEQPRVHVANRTLDHSQLTSDLQASLNAATHERVLEWLHGRLTEIGKLRPALTMLRQMWPIDDIPTTAVRDRTLRPEHVDVVDRLIGFVEAEHHIRFPPRDPRMALTGPKTSPRPRGKAPQTHTHQGG